LINDELHEEANNRNVIALELLEKEREEELAAQIEHIKKIRKFRLQYSSILVIILLIFLFTFLLTKLRVSQQVASGILFLGFLLFFEFVFVLLDPFTEQKTGGEPLLKMLINSGIALIFTILHRFIEKRIQKRIDLKSLNSE
jgi:hypothetical protein